MKNHLVSVPDKCEETLQRFESSEIVDTIGEMSYDNCALMAFGALLESADLEEFAGKPDHAKKLRVGLRQIVELYIDRQERKLRDIELRTRSTYEDVIRDARLAYEMASQDTYADRVVALERIWIPLNRMNQIVAECGDKYPEAQDIRNKLYTLQEKLRAGREAEGS